jgi:predicted metalloprotease
MTHLTWNVPAAAAALVLGATTLGAATLGAQEREDVRARPVSITTADLGASNEKVAMAYGDLVAMWSKGFQRIGERFAPPRLLRYRGVAGTPCGIMGPNNAAYCPQANAIFYDELFVAAQAKNAARDLGTDGDMAAVGIVAHEMGHAVAIQLGYASRFTYDNESVADCLAGAFANHSRRVGSLEKGDEEEAFYGMAAAGDPTPQLTGDPRWDRRIERRAAVMGHGTREQRMQNFRTGYEGGAGACIDALQGVV